MYRYGLTYRLVDSGLGKLMLCMSCSLKLSPEVGWSVARGERQAAGNRHWLQAVLGTCWGAGTADVSLTFVASAELLKRATNGSSGGCGEEQQLCGLVLNVGALPGN